MERDSFSLSTEKFCLIWRAFTWYHILPSNSTSSPKIWEDVHAKLVGLWRLAHKLREIAVSSDILCIIWSAFTGTTDNPSSKFFQKSWGRALPLPYTPPNKTCMATSS